MIHARLGSDAVLLSLSPTMNMSPLRLTMIFPEDPRAHELEEAAGVKPGPVDRNRILKNKTATFKLNSMQPNKEFIHKILQFRIPAELQLTPSYTRAFQECSNFLMNLQRDDTRGGIVTNLPALITSTLSWNSGMPFPNNKEKLNFSQKQSIQTA